MKQDISESIAACAAHYGDDAEAMRSYLTQGERNAYALDNRGAIRFDKRGNLAADILSAYSKYGFYIFENVLAEDELQDIKEDLDQIRASYPAEPNGKLTKDGKPALGADCVGPNLVWSKPLGDPLGGTELANGRHQVKLFEPEASASAPEFAPFILLGSLQFSESCLRVYGHPQLLRVAEAVNGSDFPPLMRACLLKSPELVPQCPGIRMVTPTGTVSTLMRVSTGLTLWPRSTAALLLMASG